MWEWGISDSRAEVMGTFGDEPKDNAERERPDHRLRAGRSLASQMRSLRPKMEETCSDTMGLSGSSRSEPRPLLPWAIDPPQAPAHLSFPSLPEGTHHLTEAPAGGPQQQFLLRSLWLYLPSQSSVRTLGAQPTVTTLSPRKSV